MSVETVGLSVYAVGPLRIVVPGIRGGSPGYRYGGATTGWFEGQTLIAFAGCARTPYEGVWKPVYVLAVNVGI